MDEIKTKLETTMKGNPLITLVSQPAKAILTIAPRCNCRATVMVEHARQLGANAIVGVRYDAAEGPIRLEHVAEIGLLVEQ